MSSSSSVCLSMSSPDVSFMSSNKEQTAGRDGSQTAAHRRSRPGVSPHKKTLHRRQCVYVHTDFQTFCPKAEKENILVKSFPRLMEINIPVLFLFTCSRNRTAVLLPSSVQQIRNVVISGKHVNILNDTFYCWIKSQHSLNNRPPEPQFLLLYLPELS